MKSKKKRSQPYVSVILVTYTRHTGVIVKSKKKELLGGNCLLNSLKGAVWKTLF